MREDRNKIYCVIVNGENVKTNNTIMIVYYVLIKVFQEKATERKIRWKI